MSAIDILREEHRSIERFLNVLRVVCEKLEQGEIPAVILEEILDFLLFVECHTVKEEIVYSALKTLEIPERKDPRIIGVDDWYMYNIVIIGDVKHMFADHKERQRIDEALVAAVENYVKSKKDSKKEVLHNLNLYIYLMFMHILKEDRTIYPRVNRVLKEERQREIFSNFKEIENRILGKESSEYLKFINSLEDKLNIVYKGRKVDS